MTLLVFCWFFECEGRMDIYAKGFLWQNKKWLQCSGGIYRCYAKQHLYTNQYTSAPVHQSILLSTRIQPNTLMTLDTQSHVSATCLDLLLQEMIPTSIRIGHMQESSHNNSSDIDTEITTNLSPVPGDLPGTTAIFDSASILHSDDVTLRTESFGYNLGLRLTEVLMYKAAGSATKVVDILDIMKFVCRDVWKCLYGKQMDNLRTNHRGTFVLIDSDYRLIRRLNSSRGGPDSVDKAKCYLWFPCGVIRGILASFGIDATIQADVSSFPSVTFSIHTTINN